MGWALFCWAVLGIGHYNGQIWKSYIPTIRGRIGGLCTIAIMIGRNGGLCFVIVVGKNGDALHRHYNVQTWKPYVPIITGRN